VSIEHAPQRQRKRPRRYLRINDLCERYHTSRMSIARWIKNGTLPPPHAHFGKSPLWLEAKLDRHDDARRRP
jgi:predicted DNA-binding transcriptional regulator AlpA